MISWECPFQELKNREEEKGEKGEIIWDRVGNWEKNWEFGKFSTFTEYDGEFYILPLPPLISESAPD